MPWHAQQETVEQLYLHGHLKDVFDDEGDDLEDLADAGFTVLRGGEPVA